MPISTGIIVEVSTSGIVIVDSITANAKLVIGITIKLDAIPNTQTQPTAGRHPAPNKEF